MRQADEIGGYFDQLLIPGRFFNISFRPRDGVFQARIDPQIDNERRFFGWQQKA